MSPYMKMAIPIDAGIIATSVDPLETQRTLSAPQDSESPSRLRPCPLVAAPLHLIYYSLAGMLLCEHGNKGGSHSVSPWDTLHSGVHRG